MGMSPFGERGRGSALQTVVGGGGQLRNTNWAGGVGEGGAEEMNDLPKHCPEPPS